MLHLSPATSVWFRSYGLDWNVCVRSHVLDLEKFSPKTLHLLPDASVWVCYIFHLPLQYGLGPLFWTIKIYARKCYIFHLPLQYDSGPMVWTEMFVLVSMFVCVGSNVLDLENYNPKTLHLSPATSVLVGSLVLDLENFCPKMLHLSPAISVWFRSYGLDWNVCNGSHVLDFKKFNPKLLHLLPAAFVWVVTSFTCHFSMI